MIKINLDYGQINRINKIIKQDIESNLKEDFEKVTNVLKKYECTKTLELVDDEEKLYEACTLFGKTALTEYSDKFKCAFDTDIIGRDDYKEIHKYLCCEFEKIYKNFSNRKSAYEIASIINANVCPYCNRIYTFTIAKKTRPQFDHFFPKALYPWLAISIYNLIPSCGLCNTGKSKKEPDYLLYPYEESFEDKHIHFEVDQLIKLLLSINTADEVRRNDLQKYIKLVSEDGDDKIINSYNEFFKIESIYNEHRKYIFEFIKKIQIYNDDLLKSIYESYKDIFNGVEDVRKIALGLYESRDYLQQPLSKLTNDIYEQLKY